MHKKLSRKLRMVKFRNGLINEFITTMVVIITVNVYMKKFSEDDVKTIEKTYK